MSRRWNNIKYGKAAKDAARSKIYARFGKEIYMAAKNGEPDVELNQNLAATVERARVAGVTKDIIERAINKAKSGDDESYEPVRYEGYGSGGAAIIVDALTDNVNRTVAEVRSTFKKNDGNLGVSGSVAFMFERTSLFVFEGSDEEAIMEGLLEADVDVKDVYQTDEFITVEGEPDQFNNIQTALQNLNITEFEEADMTMIPTIESELEGEKLETFMKLVDALEALDDVSNVYHNVRMGGLQ